MKIFNLAGQEVAALIYDSKTAGTHQVVWHAKGLASGIYLCRLQVGSL